MKRDAQMPGLLSALVFASLACAQVDIQLKGLKVRLGEPVQVTAQRGWQEGPNLPWAFIHPTPTMARFPTGELIVTYSLVPDTNENPKNNSGFQISTDEGKTWGRRWDVIGEHQAMIYVPQDDGALMAIPAYLYQQKPGDEHNFYAAYSRFEQGGRRVVIEPAGVRVLDWPWPVETYKGVGPGANWHVQLCFDGNAVKIGARLIATGYGQKKGEALYRNVVIASEDNGRTWRYLSTIADPMSLPALHRKGAEGPDETAMIQLADGDLMAVFRVGSGKEWNLHRAYSSDGGRTWSKAEPISAYSVEPSLIRLRNGILALSSGRPDIRLWLSTDARGNTWQDVDIMTHHNRWAPDPSYRISEQGDRPGRFQTSSYTELVEISPNKLLLVYDRGAKPFPQSAEDLTRVFVLPIEIQKQ